VVAEAVGDRHINDPESYIRRERVFARRTVRAQEANSIAAGYAVYCELRDHEKRTIASREKRTPTRTCTERGSRRLRVDGEHLLDRR
jgi:hypothetical protein